MNRKTLYLIGNRLQLDKFFNDDFRRTFGTVYTFADGSMS